ncbi:MAG: NfeD family protein [Actinomycetota bacterium]|nr:NfeD family protein [Actinomycetota bacterium]
MTIFIISFIALTVIVLLIGFHFGPHSTIASGLLSATLAVIAIVLLATQKNGTVKIHSLLLIASGLISFASIASIALGSRGLKQAAKGFSMGGDRNLSKLIGKTGTATSAIDPLGTVSVAGESWSAESVSGPIPKGSQIYVQEADQIHLKVDFDPLSTLKRREPN